MDKTNTQLPQVPAPVPPSTNWFSRHHLWGYGFLALAFLLAVAFIYQMTYKPAQETRVCVQVVTSAKNPETGEIQTFPTPCDVPQGWAEVNPNEQSGNDVDLGGTAGDAAEKEWVKYNQAYFGFEMSIPKAADVDEFDGGEHIAGFNLWMGDEPRRSSEHLLHAIFSNTGTGSECDYVGGEKREQAGWDVHASKFHFCAVRGVHYMSLSFTENFPANNKVMMDSIKLVDKKLATPKYYLYCLMSDETIETSTCSLYGDEKLLIKDISGLQEEATLLPYLGIYSGYEIVGWSGSKVVLMGGAGDACFSRGALYEVDVMTSSKKLLAEYIYGCPQTPEEESRDDAEHNEFIKTVEQVKKTLTPYPKING
jgi:hypothetical protein